MARPSTGFDSLHLKTPLSGSSSGWAIETININLAGAQTTGTGKATVLVGVAGEIEDIRAFAGTAPVGASLIFDVNKNGTTLFTTQADRPTILAAAQASSSVKPAVTTVAAGDRLSVDVDQIGSGTAGSDVVIAISIKRRLAA
jgi:hypothetical protein